MTPEQLQKIISSAKRGKRKSQNLLLEIFWRDIYNYVYLKLRKEEEAEDIAIETFAKVFTKLKLYNSDFDFKTWVVSIAHHTMIDHIRRSPKLNISLDDENLNIDIPEDLPSPEEDMINQQSTDSLKSKIEKLSPDYRKIIELRFLEEKTYKEIAQELELSMGNVKVRLFRARQLLREILEAE